jgi:ribose-phosphate pyrophosphokinase
MKKNKIIVGNGNKELGLRICEVLRLDPVDALVTTFANGETFCRINEDIRGCNVYLIQSIQPPVNNNLMELLVLADACKRASVSSIHAVIPHFGYARQDRKAEPRTPITARLVCDMLKMSGINSIVTMDIHSTQTQGFFDGPHDDIPGVAVALPQIKHVIGHIMPVSIAQVCVVSPDAGGVKRARKFSDKLGCEFAMVNKVRSANGDALAMEVIGNVKGKTCIVVDDMIDTGGTLVQCIKAIKKEGANTIYAIMTHGVLSGNGVRNIIQCEELDVLFVSNSMSHWKEEWDEENWSSSKKISVIPSEYIFAKTIMTHMKEKSITNLFV